MAALAILIAKQAAALITILGLAVAGAATQSTLEDRHAHRRHRHRCF
jgi:hypothetical protein